MTRHILTQELLFSRSTKNTHRFDAPDPDSAVSAIYVDKRAMPDGDPPARITIAISSTEAPAD